MKTIPITNITVAADRQRKEFDETALMELAESIKTQGLFHAILLTPDGQLVAGESRLRAIRQHLLPLGRTFTYDGETVPLGEVPYTEVTSTDPLFLEEAELYENIRRRDLTWVEQAEAHARLAALRQQQAARVEAPDTPPLTFPAHTTAIAKEIYGADVNDHQRSVVRQELLVAPHLHKPEVRAAKDLKEAFKVIKKLEDAERDRNLAALVGHNFTAEDHAIYQGNCLEWMQAHLRAEGEKFDVILTDPPYGMEAHTFGDAAGRLTQIAHQYDDSYESWRKLMEVWCPLSYMIAKPEAHAYVFCDIDRFHELRTMMKDSGWYVFRTPFTNYKRASGRVPLPDRGPRRQSEWLLYAIKGERRVNFIGSDVIESGSDEQLTHGAQKPVELYVELLRRSVKPGDRVLDTFAGTGTILPAAHSLKCRATAVEQNPTYYGICAGRLKELGAQQEMPV